MTPRKAGAADKGRVTVDMNDLTCSEIEQVEDLIDASIVSVMDPNGRQGKAMRALGFVVAKRTNPELTYEQAGDLRVFFKMPSPASEKDSATGS
ncbi:hypothetical protein [Actinophytocola sp. NPDC049390]|uniref:hypothetical protein n=1 Tax=Actinophytocola sp. NPDC049390 TaxID=3363894 RepID=UPI0037A493C3